MEMNRKEFLSLVGLGAAAYVCSTCLSACNLKDNVADAPSNVDFTLDLNDAGNAALKSDGGSLVKNGVIVARKSSTTYYAVSAACTHEGITVNYDAGGNRFHCNAHGSNFSTDGSVINGPAQTALTKYNTTLSGTSLRVTS